MSFLVICQAFMVQSRSFRPVSSRNSRSRLCSRVSIAEHFDAGGRQDIQHHRQPLGDDSREHFPFALDDGVAIRGLAHRQDLGQTRAAPVSARPAGAATRTKQVGVRLVDQFFERSVGQEFTVVDDRHALADGLDFLHVVAGVNHAHSVGGQLPDAFQKVRSRLRIDADRRFVENHDAGVVEQGRPRNSAAASSPPKRSSRIESACDVETDLIQDLARFAVRARRRERRTFPPKKSRFSRAVRSA